MIWFINDFYPKLGWPTIPVCLRLRASWDTTCSVPKPGKSQANWEEEVTLSRGQVKWKEAKAEIGKEVIGTDRSQDLGCLVIFVILAMFMFLLGFRHDYRVVSSLTWSIMVTEWPCLMLLSPGEHQASSQQHQGFYTVSGQFLAVRGCFSFFQFSSLWIWGMLLELT